MTLTVDPVLSLLAVVALALLFASAALLKIRDRARFAAVLEAYRLMPAPLAKILAVVLPFIELTVAFSLVLPRFRFAAALSAAVLLLIYSAAMGLNLARGRRDIDCGCEGFGRRRRIAPWMVVRNGLLAGVALIAAATPVARALAWTDVLTIAGGIAVFVLTYFAADQLLATRRLA